MDYEYNHDARTQSPRLSTGRLQLAVGQRGLGHADQEEQRTQRASCVATHRTRVHTATSGSHRDGLGYLIEKNTS